MRQIGHLTTQTEARRFVAYLLTQGIEAQAEQSDGGWSLWVRDEDHRTAARDLLGEFQQNPKNSRYDGAERSAQELLEREHRKREASRNNVVEARDRWKNGIPRRMPITRMLIVLSIVATLAGSFGLWGRTGSLPLSVREQLYFVDVRDYEETRDPLVNIKQGELWRLITPIFVHADPLASGFGVLHIVFNVYWLSFLGGMIEDRQRSARLLLVVLGSALLSNVAQGTFPEIKEGALAPLSGSVLFGGMSGVLYGTFGYVWVKSRMEPSSRLWIDSTTVAMLIIWLFLCMTGMLGPIANVAHAAGFLAGIAFGVVLPPVSRPTPPHGNSP